MSNGELIQSAEQSGYEILLTCDQNVRYQQNLTRRKISMIPSALGRTSPGWFEFIEIAPPPKRRWLTSSKGVIKAGIFLRIGRRSRRPGQRSN